VGAEETSFVSKFFSPVASLVLYLDGLLAMRGKITRLERENVHFAVNRFPWFHLTTKDADIIVDDREDLRRSAQSFVVEETLPRAFECTDRHRDSL
jgi:hypothetical protein